MRLPQPLPTLRRRQVQLWWATPSQVDLVAAARVLDATERARIPALLRPTDRTRFVTAAALLRFVVAGHTGRSPATVLVDRRCPDCARPHGKPRLPGSGLHVSLSHSGNRVLLAVTRTGPIGVDVQLADDSDISSLASLVLDADEPLPAGGSARTAAFYRYWVRKESLVKAAGVGLRVPLKQVVVSRHDRPARLVRWADRHPAATLLVDLPAGSDYHAAVTVFTAEPLEFTTHHAATSRPAATPSFAA